MALERGQSQLPNTRWPTVQGPSLVTNIGEKVYEINYDGYEEDIREWVSRDKVLGLV